MDTIAQKQKMPFWLFPVTVAAAAGAQFVPVLYLVLPALVAATLLYTDRPAAMTALLSLPSMGFAVYLCYGGPRAEFISAMCLAALGYFGGILLLRMQKKKQSGFHTAGVTAAFSIAMLYLASCLEGVISGAGAFTAIRAFANNVAQEVMAMLASALRPENAVPLETYGAFFENFDDTVVLMLVPALCICGCVIGLSNTLFFRLFVKKDREALGLMPMRPLREWSIPKEYSIGITVMLVGAMILMFMGSESSDAVSTTVIALVSFPLTIQAIAFIDWLIVRKGTHIAFKRTLMAILIVGLFNFISNLLVTIGVFEQIFHARAHLAAMGKDFRPWNSDREDKK